MILDHDLIANRQTAAIFAGLPPVKRLVDVGCGIRPCPAFHAAEHICIEPHAEYVKILEGWAPPDRKVSIIQETWPALAKLPRQDTTVLVLDMIEHLDRSAGEELLRLLAEFDHAVVFTPLGFVPQASTNPDAWGLNGGYWQGHRSGWDPTDFKNWTVHVWRHWHENPPAGAIMAVR